MVSTRGGARTDAVAPPVRKATSRNTLSKTTRPTVATTKRSRVQKGETEVEHNDQVEADISTRGIRASKAKSASVRDVPMTATAKNGGTTRAKKAVTIVEPTCENDDEEVANFKMHATRATKVPTTSSNPKSAPAKQEPRTTITRTTRNASRIEPTAPLSPKKITQVSRKSTTRARKASEGQNSTARPTRSGASSNEVKTGRRRQISNENVDPEQQEMSIDEKSRRRSNGRSDPEASIENVAPETAPSPKEVPTTPPISKRQSGSFESHRSDVNSNPREHGLSSDESEDELCGPKTPMRRCSPREAYRMAGERSALRMQSSAMRFSTLPVRPRTPQTQITTSQQHVPSSALAPMTLGRGFRTRIVQQSVPSSPRGVDPDVTEGDEPVELPQEDFEDPTLEYDDADIDESFSQDTVSVNDSLDLGLLPGNAAEAHPEMHDEDDGNESISTISAEDENDLNETDYCVDEPLSDSEHSVLFTPHGENDIAEDVSFDEVDDRDDSVLVANLTPQPQTMLWENVHQHVIIPMDFDSHLMPSPRLPQIEQTERLCEVMTAVDLAQGYAQADDGSIDRSALSRISLTKEKSFRSRESLDNTMNYSEFLDLAALADDATQRLSLQPCADVEMEGNAEQQHLTSDVEHDMPVYSMLSDDVLGEPRGSAEMTDHGTTDLVPRTPNRRRETELTRVGECELPHYALPTMASAMRRKSLPAFASVRETESFGARPNTSDGIGASMRDATHIVNMFTAPSHQMSMSAAPSWCTPARKGMQPVLLATSGRSASALRRKPEPTMTAMHSTPRIVESRASPTRTPVTSRATRPIHSAQKSQTRLTQTAMPVMRFRTPVRKTSQISATAQKPVSLHRIALAAAPVSRLTETPTKTPIEAPCLTPGPYPMTPHPAAPLRRIVAFVEVFTNDGAPASAAFIALLHRLGAKTTRSWSDRITHVVWKEGSPKTLSKVKMNNRNVETENRGNHIYCVNSRWVTDCDSEGRRMDEQDEAYTVQYDDISMSSKRRRKSMEPATLVNIDGNIVQDRKSSLSKATLHRLSLKPTPSPTGSPAMRIDRVAEKENSGVESGASSPATPAYLAAPDSLVQQTAPLNRVRRLNLGTDRRLKVRRLTSWTGEE